VADNGASTLRHVSDELHGDFIDAQFAAHEVNAVPTFVVINDDGESRLTSGWSESGLREDLDWAIAS